jgi:hypothetical protein
MLTKRDESQRVVNISTIHDALVIRHNNKNSMKHTPVTQGINTPSRSPNNGDYLAGEPTGPQVQYPAQKKKSNKKAQAHASPQTGACRAYGVG